MPPKIEKIVSNSHARNIEPGELRCSLAVGPGFKLDQTLGGAPGYFMLDIVGEYTFSKAASVIANASLGRLGEALNDSPGVKSLTQLQQSLNQSPALVAQAKLAAALQPKLASPAVQLQDERFDEDELQLKSDPMTAFADSRLEEEEEVLQGKSATVQRQGDLEDEELLQGKFAPVQRQDFDEEDAFVVAELEKFKELEDEQRQIMLDIDEFMEFEVYYGPRREERHHHHHKG